MLAKRGVDGVAGSMRGWGEIDAGEMKRACAPSKQFFALFNVIKMSLNSCRCTTLRIRNVRFMSNCSCWATVAVLFAFGINSDALRMLYANLIKEFKHLCLSKVCGLPAPPPWAIWVECIFRWLLCKMFTAEMHNAIRRRVAQVENELGSKMFETIKISFIVFPFLFTLFFLREHWQQF